MTAVELAIIVNSALYLAGCIAAGLATGNRVAWTLSLITAGWLYLGYLAHMQKWLSSVTGTIFVVGSIILGAVAGIALLVS